MLYVGKETGYVGIVFNAGEERMPKIAKPLSAIEVKRLIEVGLHSVGTVSGLCLSVSASGSRSWILRVTIGSRRSDMGLGSYPEITLQAAHERARKYKDDIKNGINPIAERQARRQNIEWTFKRCAEAYIKSQRTEWKNDKHTQQVENTLKTYAYPKIGSMHVKDIAIKDVLRVIESEWTTKTETMRRVRQRIEAILAWAGAMGYREKQNPAVWRNNLDQVLAKRSKTNKPKPHPALQIKDVQGFTKALTTAEGQGAKCLQFAMLTACRSGEARGAAWSEINLKAAEWLIPSERMKADKDHRIPLSKKAIALLKSLVKFEGTDLIFAGQQNKQLSDMTLAAVIKRMNKPKVVWADDKGKPVVPHGLRSTFATWSQECTNYASELREHALAHTVGNAVTQSYERGAQFEKRRALMQDWANFCHAPVKAANVTDIRARSQ
jgi:integrase